ncbi:Z1 domain-containing protein [Kitasatospora purpeofusca]|uniref:Z1 domain-containing protein n=1 Tax=Kitasatospora purpeofusca TaxID=67352 RepID=UPI002A5A57F6|nr:Z1 domain-containing protein [Kitasatospora purpeofusca]MDY0811002.1 Z1 domain-containing protein [Kitasatospora purpeofusca]
MEDPRIEAAWKRFQSRLDTALPHEVTQELRDLFVPDHVIEELLRRHDVETTRIASLREPLALGRENTLPWYTGPRAEDKNWPAFEGILRRALGADSAQKIDEASTKVVAMLDHPATPAFRSRGLVVGHVQSGKTSNFTGVVCKAADRGYRMFIVLSGIHNSLRRQTQARLIRDVVNLNPPLWHQITSPERDFVPPPNAQSFLASKDQRLLLVVKKNAVVLRKLRDWLEQAQEQLGNCPTLIIDDEADQATLATRRINPLIRDVITRLPKVCYVGYTATPFANLLSDPLDHEDFYPRDFILSLPRGAEYQGPETLFGRHPLDGEDPAEVPGGLDMIRTIPDDELDDLRPKKQAAASGFAPVVTRSLRRAALWFWLATAARHSRGQQDQHSSMLVHAHSDTRVHDSYGPPLRALQEEVAVGLADRDTALLEELRLLWEDETARVDPSGFGNLAVGFDEVLDHLDGVVKRTRIVMDHYRSNDRLDYDSGPVNVIAVGGNTLSRGLTLEGLVVSFFVRSSNVYDTLLQMGRWFGYRPGYGDLPRIFMPDETRRWFMHLATVEEEMRKEIDRYLTEHKSPLELAVRIRCHPKMRVTAPSKAGAAVRTAASYGGQLVETRYFPCLPVDDALKWHERNADAVLGFLAAASTDGRVDRTVKPGRALWREVPLTRVLDFIGAYQFHPKSVDASADLMVEYIRRRNESGALASWNVGVIGNAVGADSTPLSLPNGITVAPVTRTRLAASASDEVADIKTLTGSRDEALDLKIPQSEGSVNRSRLQELRVQQQPERGLVMLYPIDARSEVPVRKHNGEEKKIEGRAPLDAPGDIVWGAALVFPRPSKGGRELAVEYDYVAADLRQVFPSAGEDDSEDVSVLYQDLDSDAEGSA